MSIPVTEMKAEVASEIGIIDALFDDSDNVLSNFRLLSENAVPIPPTIGEKFQSFYEEGLEALKPRHKEWTDNIKLFMNTDAGNGIPKENLVRTTVETLLDYTYMRNPQAEFTSSFKEEDSLKTVLQQAVTALINKKSHPGINLRPKIIKQIIMAHLTNLGCIELCYQSELGSLDQVLQVTEKIKEKIKQETDPEKAAPLYEYLDIIQKDLDHRKYHGIEVKFRSPFAFIFDPDSSTIDLSDSKILMMRDAIDIDYIKAEFMTFDGNEEGTFYFKYDQSQSFNFSAERPRTKEATEEQVIADLFPEIDDEQRKRKSKNKMPVVWVYDKTTRLKYLYIEGQWETPLWVYEDEMKLSRFFPFFFLAFSTPLQSIVQAGEVEHYKDFQTEINSINAQETFARRLAFSTYLYDANAVDKEEVQKLFKTLHSSTNPFEILGIKLKDSDKTLQEVLEPFKLPSTQFKEIFNKEGLINSMNKITRITDAMRGAEFRTNTTNDAIAEYSEFANNRIESLTDKIEESVSELLWSISELLVSLIPEHQIAQLLPEEAIDEFTSMTVQEFNQNYTLQVVAGSTEKPTSIAKKKEATSIIQMLGQFGTAAPKTVLGMVTRLLRDVFSRNYVSDKDLENLEAEGNAAMQKGISTEQQPGVRK
jgi:hypothetical protein